MKTPLLDIVRTRPLIGDGAMGTQLMLAGLEQGGCGEAWNLTHPDKVLGIQRRYAVAGSDCIITNTFGGSRIMLNRHGHAGDVAEVNKAAVAIAREAFGGKPGYVLGDVGPFGGLMEPYGDFTEAQVRDAFNEQAQALVDGGADAIIMEHGAHVVALNGGTGMERERARDAVLRYRAVTSLPIMVQPNAGVPKLVNMKVVYDETPDHMGCGVVPLVEAGANIVGACCGSTPDHIREFRRLLDTHLATMSAGTRA